MMELWRERNFARKSFIFLGGAREAAGVSLRGGEGAASALPPPELHIYIPVSTHNDLIPENIPGNILISAQLQLFNQKHGSAIRSYSNHPWLRYYGYRHHFRNTVTSRG